MRRPGALFFVSLALAAGACDSTPPESPVIPTMVLEGEEKVLEGDAETDDFWLTAYGHYFDADEVAEYLACPPEERFDRYGPRLLDLAVREALLEEHRDRLSAEEVEQYHRLPDYEACEAFLAKRAAEGPPPEE